MTPKKPTKRLIVTWVEEVEVLDFEDMDYDFVEAANEARSALVESLDSVVFELFDCENRSYKTVDLIDETVSNGGLFSSRDKLMLEAFAKHINVDASVNVSDLILSFVSLGGGAHANQ